MSNVRVGRFSCTLFYDYDQTRDGKLSRMSDNERIEWFRQRSMMVFVEPFRILFNKDSIGYKEINSTPEKENPKRTISLAAFSSLLNGIESFGALYQPRGRSGQKFKTFIATFMPIWDVPITLNGVNTNIIDCLWKHFRCALAHCFMIEDGGINIYQKPEFIIEFNTLQVNPNLFFKDFEKGINMYFQKVKTDQAVRSNFFSSFGRIYPY